MTEGEGFRLISRFELFVDELMDLTKKFPKGQKYSLGAKIDDTALCLCQHLYLATYCREIRQDTLYQLRARIHLMGFLLRMSHKQKLISHGQFNKLTKEQSEFAKMISSWIKRTNAQCHTECGEPRGMNAR